MFPFIDPQSVQVQKEALMNPQAAPVQQVPVAIPVPVTAAAPIAVNQPAIPQGFINSQAMPTMSAPTNMGPAADDGEGLRAAMRQSFGGASGPPIPLDYQKRIDDIKKLIEPGDLVKRYMDEMKSAFGTPKQSGFRSRLTGVGKALLMGEGLPGVFRGASDPTATSIRYKLSKNAPLGQAAQQEEAFNASKLNRAGKIGEITGIDQLTGLETPMAAYRRTMAEASKQRSLTGQDRADTAKLNTASQIEDRRKRWASRTTQQMVQLYNDGALNNNPEALIEMGERVGIPNPETIEPKTLSTMIKTFVDENYKLNTINTKTGEVKNTGATTVDKTKEANKTQNYKTLAGQRERTTRVSEESLAERRRVNQINAQQKARETALKEYPQPKPPKGIFGDPPTAEQMQEHTKAIADWQQKVRQREEEIMSTNPPPAQSSASPPAAAKGGNSLQRINQTLKGSIPDGSEVVDIEVSPSTHKKRYKVRLKDGSETYFYPR